MIRLQGTRDLRRQKPSRRERRRLLLVTEGKKTEPGYMRGLLRLLRATAVDVHSVDVQHAGVTHPLGIVRETIKIRDKTSDPYDECWCLVDVDNHTSLASACTLARAEDINIAVSNPCFEIWLLWHYRDHRAATSGKYLRQQLRTLGHPDKSIPESFPFAACGQALKRSQEAAPGQAQNSVGPNPSTTFGLVLGLLQPEPREPSGR